ncbi:MAG TPA: peptide MFS transporter [Pyrinomonadaceae bacterium]|jgi:POT family proton-dependent oligopeptide transporter|nr:peptide MFS transporter [Pyrinomonadaceae bacterium]
MTADAAAIARDHAGAVATDKHPKGLYVLFATEMWERFSFYSMLALFTLYLQDPADGFGWTAERATTLYSWYLMFVYASPLVGGFIADRKLGYRRSVMIGGFFFMAGHLLLAFRSITAVYAALTCLVIGNGFFKPNVSTMVGNLYPEGSHLKDRAYNIFYMGINIGAFLAPIVAEFVKQKFGVHPAFAVAAGGMVISVAILWYFQSTVKEADERAKTVKRQQEADAAAVAVDAPPSEASHQKSENLVDNVPDWKRVSALIVIFIIVIVFWMAFHQNGSTLTYWADDNTAWDVSGTISNAINPFWIISLTFPLVWFWKWLDTKGKEPSTPTKMAIGMFLTALSFFVLYAAAKSGEGQTYTPEQFAAGSFRVTERSLDNLQAQGVPADVIERLKAKDEKGKYALLDRKFSAGEDGKTTGQQNLQAALSTALGPDAARHTPAILQESYLFRVSPFWLILAYAIISLGELMLSPMGLSLVSKVAPIRMRGLLMGGWFVATAIGNKLTAIGTYWTYWKQSSFFIILGGMAFVMAIVLLTLLRPLKKAMPGV